MGSGDHISVIDKDVQIEVLVAPPQTDQQRDVFEEASQVFNEVNAIVTQLNDAESVGVRAAELVEAN